MKLRKREFDIFSLSFLDVISCGFGAVIMLILISKPNDDIGYVTRVYKGIKENGSIFSHPNPWAVIAECKLGRGNKAMKFYDAMLPYNQNDIIEVKFDKIQGAGFLTD